MKNITEFTEIEKALMLKSCIAYSSHLKGTTLTYIKMSEIMSENEVKITENAMEKLTKIKGTGIMFKVFANTLTREDLILNS